MTVIINLEQLENPLKKAVLTIGNFDGVHIGHLALFNKVKERAVSIGGQSAVMTFEPHPLKVMRAGSTPPLITPTRQKMKLLDQLGIDVILCVPFTREFAAISARDFVRDILVDKIGVTELVVGYDYSFGHKREGNIELLRELGTRAGFKVHIVEPVSVDHTLVSSTSIRRLVQKGELAEAKKLLGRDYQMCGKVVKGKNRGGRQLGFPTANLDVVDELTPKVGVYAVRVHIEDQIYDGLTNIGYNPTFGNNKLSVETHILDFSGDLLGKTIKIDFIERLRDEKTFDTVKDLADQIGRDILRARDLFQKRN